MVSCTSMRDGLFGHMREREEEHTFFMMGDRELERYTGGSRYRHNKARGVGR